MQGHRERNGQNQVDVVVNEEREKRFILRESARKVSAVSAKTPIQTYEFMALNISTTTKILKLMVVARILMVFENISQPISGNMEAHLW